MSSKLHDTKSDFIGRKILSFFLFLSLVLLSIACVAKGAIINGNMIENKFTSYAAVSALRQDIITFTKDGFLKNGLNDENINDIISQAKVEAVAKSFAASEFKSKTGYTKESSKQDVAALCNEIKSEIVKQVKASGFEYNEKAVNTQVQKIDEFINAQLVMPGSKYIETAFNVGKIGVNIFVAVSVFLTLVFGSMLFFTGKREYRSIRSIGVSFCSAGIADLFASIIALIIFSIKSIDIYPMFIKNAIDSYISTSIGAVAACGACFILITLVLLAISWKLKRER